MIIGYFTNQYPKVSHSFIRREILALEALGVTVERWALRGWDAEIVDPVDLSERERTRFLLRDGVVALLWAAVAMLGMHPRRGVAAAVLSLKMVAKTDRSVPKHIVSFLEAARLAREMRAARVTHLHAHFGTNAAEVAMVAATLAGIPYSFTVHGPDEFDRPIATHLALKIAHAAFVVAITPFCASQLYRWCDHADWRKIVVVRCGISADFLDAAQTPPPAAAHFVCVGRLSAQKGQLLLIEAMAEVRRRGIPASLTLVGDGEMRGEIEAAIARHHLGDAVTITGWADEARVRTELRAARALVLASFAEGLPIVVMEALALGRPVLATNVAAMADLVISGTTGWLYTPGSAGVIADSLEACATATPETLAAMGDAGRRLVREHHDADHQAALLGTYFDGQLPDITHG